MKKLEQLVSDYKEIKNKFQSELKEAFLEGIKDFFENNPEVKIITWSQYSPYFNDGDECTFSVCEPVFSNGEDVENIEYYGETYEEGVWVVESGYDLKYLPSDVTDSINFEDCWKLSSLITSSEMEEILLDMFDNHVRVIVTKDEIKVEEYEHD